MYVTQGNACTVPNSTTPISAAQLARSAARVAAQDAQYGQLLQKWVTMIDRTPESFSDLGMAPSEFRQPQSAADLLNLDSANDQVSLMAAARAGAVCNPSADGPTVVPLNGYGDSLPITEPVNLLAKGPLGRPRGNGLNGVQDLQPYVQAQRVAARRRRARHSHGAGLGCSCGGSCGPCSGNAGMGAVSGSTLLWGSIAGFGLLLLMGKKGR